MITLHQPLTPFDLGKSVATEHMLSSALFCIVLDLQEEEYTPVNFWQTPYFFTNKPLPQGGQPKISGLEEVISAN